MSTPGLRTVRTHVLEIAYKEAGSPGGEPVLLLHGWPDSVRIRDAVVHALTREGYRCLAPYLRGFGPTRFIASSTPRSGQATALAQDAKDFADALGLDRFILMGHDWGGFAAYLVAASWPERVKRLVVLSVGYGSTTANRRSRCRKRGHSGTSGSSTRARGSSASSEIAVSLLRFVCRRVPSTASMMPASCQRRRWGRRAT